MTKDSIALIGFMATGKTAVGQKLAKKLGNNYRFIETDQLIIKEASKNGTLDGKNHPGLKRDKGYIGFLGHGSELFFRNIRIKDLSK